MKLEQLESRVYDEESRRDEQLKSSREKELVESVERILESERYKIGEGRTAEVFYPEHNERLCLKIIRDVEAYGRGLPERYSRFRKREQRPSHNSLLQEGDFLGAVEHLHPEVGVPSPHVALSLGRSEEGDMYWIRDDVQALLMNRLSGCETLRKIMDEDIPFPKGFDVGRFFVHLREFTAAMHQEKHIFHRDLHDGNIMLDLSTGKPHVIDFGSAVYGTADTAYFDEAPNREGTFLIRDEDNLDKVERLVRKYLTTLE